MIKSIGGWLRKLRFQLWLLTLSEEEREFVRRHEMLHALLSYQAAKREGGKS